MPNTKCKFCGSVQLIFHSEGVTCSECSRCEVDYCDTQYVYHNHQTEECEVIKEISFREGINKNISDLSQILRYSSDILSYIVFNYFQT